MRGKAVTLNEAAQLLGVGKSYILTLIRRGLINYIQYHTGGRMLIPFAEIIRITQPKCRTPKEPSEDQPKKKKRPPRLHPLNRKHPQVVPPHEFMADDSPVLFGGDHG